MNEAEYYTLARMVVDSLPQSALREALVNIFAAVLQSNARMLNITANYALAQNALRTTEQYCQQTAKLEDRKGHTNENA